jgi:ubiquinone/menaquinone biosynthesis C-methylase UbiE
MPAGGRATHGTGGERFYTERLLAVYDVLVLGFSLQWIWGCPSVEVLRLYDAHIGPSHLDLGVGTGYFLDRCRLPAPEPRMTLLDLNLNCLERAARRLQRYRPVMIRADALEPLPMRPATFDSVGASLLLHCLPGTMVEKCRLLARVRPLLKQGGRLFGATVLGRDGRGMPWSRAVLRHYNRIGLFTNLDDDLAGLRRGLADHFSTHEVRQCGFVALFVAQP